jgi:hypothetical protein
MGLSRHLTYQYTFKCKSQVSHPLRVEEPSTNKDCTYTFEQDSGRGQRRSLTRRLCK